MLPSIRPKLGTFLFLYIIIQLETVQHDVTHFKRECIIHFTCSKQSLQRWNHPCMGRMTSAAEVNFHLHALYTCILDVCSDEAKECLFLVFHVCIIIYPLLCLCVLVALLPYRDGEDLDELLERQADMIRYLQQHNANLGRRILELQAGAME